MNELKVFNYGTHEVRTVLKDGEPYWVLKDLCEVLGLTTPARVAERLDEDEVSLTHIIDSLGRSQEMTVINESGLYNVIIRSDKSEAKPFRKWVTSEVLPSIRKHGLYATEDLLANPDLAIRAFEALKEEREKRKLLEKKRELDAPKVRFAESVEASENSILIGELAKYLKQYGLDIGQNRLFERLRDEGYLIRQRGESYNQPTQRSMEMGLMEIKKRTITNPDGSTRTTTTTKITGKGQIYFVNRFAPKRESAQKENV